MTPLSSIRSSVAVDPVLPLRRFGAGAPRVILVAASTGGPQALATFLQRVAPDIDDVPVVVLLHMLVEFVASVSRDIAYVTGRPTSLARAGMRLQPGHVYFAVGPRHCKVIRLGSDVVFAESDAPPVRFCKPAADILFRSAADAFGAAALGVVLTGMGTDGLAGATAIIEAGGSVIAQDEETSAVWGMPGAVARAGLCAAILPLGALAHCVTGRLQRGRQERRSC